jgi:lysophospholipase L1-like esterase
MRLFQQSGSGEQMQPLAAIVSIPFWKELTKAVQRLGEKFFAALVFVALLQGGVAVFQYRTNPSGELIIPPGPTVGVEDPNGVEETEKTSSVTSKSGSATLKATSLRSGAQVANRTSDTAVPTYTEQIRQKQPQTKTTERSYDTFSKLNQNRYAAILNRLNKLLVVLVPWFAGQAGILLQQYTHLFHIGSALTLASVFDVPQSYFRKHNGSKNASFEQSPKKPEHFSLLDPNKQEYHVVVVGDSLAVGLGTVEQFDKNKNNSVPFMRIENTAPTTNKDNNHPGPAFPRALARTLSQKLQKCVTWRSAGVDGGDVPQIQHFCLGVVEEEVKKGTSPDVVVILCGANDMKYFLSNPFQKDNWPKGFRAKLSHFIREIRALAPDTIVLLPANPTQMFHKNSPLNVFPLGLLLDTMVGFWDSQKKLVADSFPSDGVLYLGLSPQEINDWYQPESVWNEEEMSRKRNNTTDILRLIEDINNLDEAKLSSATPTISLIAGDGVHPNARCYAHWAKSMGDKLLTSLSSSG